MKYLYTILVLIILNSCTSSNSTYNLSIQNIDKLNFYYVPFRNNYYAAYDESKTRENAYLMGTIKDNSYLYSILEKLKDLEPLECSNIENLDIRFVFDLLSKDGAIHTGQIDALKQFICIDGNCYKYNDICSLMFEAHLSSEANKQTLER